MAENSANPAFDLLREIERRSRADAFGLPQQDEIKTQWSGIEFRLDQVRLLTSIDHVVEILPPPARTKVPGAKGWVLGISNVRGNLIPIMDLDGYLRGRSTPIGKRSRVLVINHRGVFAGLLVDEVYGLRHIPEENRSRERLNVNVSLVPYLDRAYSLRDETLPVFNMHKLAESPLFMQVAV